MEWTEPLHWVTPTWLTSNMCMAHSRGREHGGPVWGGGGCEGVSVYVCACIQESQVKKVGKAEKLWSNLAVR